jgi:hypothetical protein
VDAGGQRLPSAIDLEERHDRAATDWLALLWLSTGNLDTASPARARRQELAQLVAATAHSSPFDAMARLPQSQPDRASGADNAAGFLRERRSASTTRRARTSGAIDIAQRIKRGVEKRGDAGISDQRAPRWLPKATRRRAGTSSMTSKVENPLSFIQARS